MEGKLNTIDKKQLIKLHQGVIVVLILIFIYSLTDKDMVHLRVLTIISLFTNYIFMRITELTMDSLDKEKE